METISKDDGPTKGAHRGRGKWSQDSVPHKGWVCIGSEDLERDLIICEMCESALVRYVHYLEHENYPDVLSVGCVCAEHMEENYVAPRIRERWLKNKAARRNREREAWLRKEWMRSYRGNLWMKRGKLFMTIFSAGTDRFKFCISSSEDKYFSEATYSSEEEAKGAIWDTLS